MLSSSRASSVPSTGTRHLGYVATRCTRATLVVIAGLTLFELAATDSNSLNSPVGLAAAQTPLATAVARDPGHAAAAEAIAFDGVGWVRGPVDQPGPAVIDTVEAVVVDHTNAFAQASVDLAPIRLMHAVLGACLLLCFVHMTGRSRAQRGILMAATAVPWAFAGLLLGGLTTAGVHALALSSGWLLVVLVLWATAIGFIVSSIFESRETAGDPDEELDELDELDELNELNEMSASDDDHDDDDEQMSSPGRWLH